MAEERKISVIIPVYNTEKFVERCVRSILNNTYKNLEVICVNDGSKDKSLEILNKLAEEDSRVVVIDKENGGVSSARNAGLDAATGDFISFVDSDDWIHPQFFEILFRAADESNAVISACNYISVNKHEKFSELYYETLEINAFSRNEAFNNHLLRKYMTARLYKSELLKNIRFSNKMTLSEDNVFNIQALCENPEEMITFVNEKMYFYFNNADSITHTVNCARYLDAAEWYVGNIGTYSDKYAKMCLLDQAYKNVWTCRYGARFSLEKKDTIKKARKLLKSCNEYVSVFSTKKKLMYIVFSFFPFTYRLFRIITDPTMIKWEKKQKKILRELKKNEKN